MRRLFMTTATRDQPGRLVEEVEVNDEPQQYLEPVSYAEQAEADAALKALRAQVAAAVKALSEAGSSGASVTQIMRMKETVRSLKEELASAEFGKSHGGSTDQAPRTDPLRKTAPREGTHFNEVVQGFAKSVAALVAPDLNKKMDAFDKWIVDVWNPMQAKKKRDQLLRDGGTAMVETKDAPPKGATHQMCCQGKYLCAACEAKKRAAA